LDDILTVPNPWVGMIIYVIDTRKRYEVLSIHDVQQGLGKVSRIDQYRELPYANKEYVDDAIANAQINSGNGESVNLEAYAKKDDIPTKLSELENDTSYVNEKYVTDAISNVQVDSGGATFNYDRLDKSSNLAVWNALGDSITFGMGTTKQYHSYIKDAMGIATVNNYGINSSEVTSPGIQPMCERYATMADNAEVITVFAGVNDFLHNKKIGVETSVDTSELYGALNVLLPGLKEKYPNGRIGYITPLKVRYGVFDVNTDGTNKLGYVLADYVNAIKISCAKHDIPILDLNALEGFDPNVDEINSTYFADGLHPNAKGHGVIYPHIMEFIKQLYNTSVVLKDENKQPFYPKTMLDNIYDMNGGTLNSILEEIINRIAQIENANGIVPVKGIALDNTEIQLSVNNTVQLNAIITPSNATNTNVVWSTSNDNCTVVDGLVKGVKQGECVITATTEDGNKKATCQVYISATLLASAEDSVIYVNIPNDNYELTLLSADAQIVNGGSIDWGDSQTSKVASASASTHTYAKAGEYCIAGGFTFGTTAPHSTLSACLTKVEQLSTLTTNLDNAFADCKQLTRISPINRVSVTGMKAICKNCENLEEFDLSCITITQNSNLSQCFWNCKKIAALDFSNCGNVAPTGMYYAFNTCSALTDLNLSNFNMQNCAETTSWLASCSALTNFVAPQKISNNITLNNANLTVESLLSAFANLNTVTGKTLTIGATNLAKLSESDKAIATGKGWTLA
jgi:lysophospholipase L1-like esterase